MYIYFTMAKARPGSPPVCVRPGKSSVVPKAGHNRRMMSSSLACEDRKGQDTMTGSESETSSAEECLELFSGYRQLVAKMFLLSDSDRAYDALGQEQSHHIAGVVCAHAERCILLTCPSPDGRRLHGPVHGPDDRRSVGEADPSVQVPINFRKNSFRGRQSLLMTERTLAVFPEWRQPVHPTPSCRGVEAGD